MAIQQPGTKFVGVKTLAQQATLPLHRQREMLMRMTNIADYIVGFYNSVRLHSKLGNLPPNAFEQKSAIKLPIAVSGKT